MDEIRDDAVEPEQDEITDSINRIEKNVSKLNAKVHLVKLMTQDIHDLQKQGVLTKLKNTLDMNETTRLAVLVSLLCGVVSASIVWLFLRVF